MTRYNPFDTEDQKPKTGPYSICVSYREKIQKSIAYYEGRYAPSKGEKIIPKRYLEFLIKLI